ncbi:MAG: ECF transporter S component [Eubacteriales bacterium]|nr:ECF transporter S component [Eubacteriales bacterium]
MKDKKIRRMVLCALFAALVCLMTLVHINIPATGGYIHPGDGMIMAAGFVLGGPFAALAAGLGSLLADLWVGAALYAPATLVIKALMGLLAGLVGKTKSWWVRIGVMALAEVIMLAGYFLFEGFVVGWVAAAAGIYMNLIQAVGGVAIGAALVALAPRVLPKGMLSQE